MKRFSLKYKLLVLTVVALGVWGAAVELPFIFKAGEVISAQEMNDTLATLNDGKQERVGGTCAAGSAIRSIGTDGSVACEVDDIGSSGNAGVDAINGMTGAITLQAGDNITIDDSTAGQITISATAGGTNTNEHDHFGQSWTGSTPESGLTVINTAPDNDGPAAIVGRVGPAGGSLGLNAIGVWGETPSGAGVVGSSGGFGVFGFSPGNRGVYGDSESGYGVYGESSASDKAGVYGTSPFIAVRGEGGNVGVAGSSTNVGGIGVLGSNESSGTGVHGSSSSGTGVYGQTSGDNYGVRGYSPAGRGVYGESQSGVGVYGYSTSNDAVVGVTATGNTTNAAIVGSSDNGYAAYFEAGLGVGQGYAVCSFKAGTTNWSCSSDRNLKENFEPVDTRGVLEAVANMPVTTWNLKGSDIRQLGPTSQDFYAAFGLGDSDTTINGTNAQGVALAAIQGLYQLVQEQQQVMQAQGERIAELEAKLGLE